MREEMVSEYITRINEETRRLRVTVQCLFNTPSKILDGVFQVLVAKGTKVSLKCAPEITERTWFVRGRYHASVGLPFACLRWHAPSRGGSQDGKNEFRAHSTSR
jgi:hypothetical protein